MVNNSTAGTSEASGPVVRKNQFQGVLFKDGDILRHQFHFLLGVMAQMRAELIAENFRLDFAVSREQTNEKGEKMYIQTRMAQYAEELWELLKKDNTYIYMCGLKGMENGIDDIMVSLAERDGIDWMEYKRQLKKAEQWNVEVY